MNKKKTIILLSVLLITGFSVAGYFYYKYINEKVITNELRDTINTNTASDAQVVAKIDPPSEEEKLAEENIEAIYKTQVETWKEIVEEKFIPQLISYLNSSEGQEYHMIQNDQRRESNLYMNEKFIHNEDGFALLLSASNKNDNNYKEKLLVFSEDGSGNVSIIYNETFYNKALIEPVYPQSDSSAINDNFIYMNTEDLINPPNTGIRIIQQDEPDAVVIYDRKFDNIHKFIQKPASALSVLRSGD